MFEGASNMAEGVDRTLILIFVIAFIFIAGITVFMIYTVVHFSRKKGRKPAQFTGSVTLEIIWTVIPLILVMLMFYYGWSGFAKMRNVPADAMTVTAIGRMWEWEFDYGDSLRSKDLVIPVNKAVKINLRSEDVNHSLFIPAFRVKEDVIPGYNNYLWFIPAIVGEYEILCTEYCGLLHSSMLAKAKVLEQEDYDKWFTGLKDSARVPAPDGYLLLRNTGCIACHSLDGARLVGPTFRGLYGKETIIQSGNSRITVTVDQDYITRSIYDPDTEIAEGFQKGLMKSYRDLLSQDEILIIIEYLKTLAGD